MMNLTAEKPNVGLATESAKILFVVRHPTQPLLRYVNAVLNDEILSKFPSKNGAASSGISPGDSAPERSFKFVLGRVLQICRA